MSIALSQKTVERLSECQVAMTSKVVALLWLISMSALPNEEEI
jgi:hypothetical protein